MNSPLHMASYAHNPMWYLERPGRVVQLDNPELKEGFYKAISKIFSVNE
jgi:hypothetical protein